MAYPNLIVKDAEFEDAAGKYGAFQSTLTEAVKQYKTVLTNISTYAIPSGATHDALVVYMRYLDILESVVGDLEGRFEKIVNNFIADLERADDYLYEAGIPNTVRDFSQERYEHLVSCLDDPWCEITDSFGDWWTKLIMDLLSFFDKDAVKQGLNSCHRLLLDYNDETKQGLNYLFNDAHSIDRKYAVSIAGATPGDGDYYTSYFAYVSLTMYGIRDILNEMAAIMKDGRAAFTIEQIHNRLSPINKEMLGYYQKTVEISKIYEAPTIGEISDFASQPWAATYFAGFNNPIGEYIENIGFWEGTQMVLFEMFGITKDRLIHGGDGKLTADEILALFYGHGWYVTTKQLTGDGYDVYLAKKQLMNVLQEMSDNYVFSESDEKKTLDNCKDYLAFYEKFGEKWYEKMNTTRGEDGKLLLDGRTKEAKQFKKYLESLGNAQDILKYGSAGIDYLSRLFCDYSAGLEIIDSFERNFSDDEIIMKAVADVRGLYNKEFGAWAKEAYNVGKELGFDIILDKAGNACPVVAVVNAIGDGIDLVGDATGLGSKAENMFNSLVIHNLYCSSERAYNNALTNFQKQIPGTEEYDIAAKDLKNCFELQKGNLEQLFKTMAAASGADRQSYYEYCAKQASMLSMKDSGCPDILSFEEFSNMQPMSGSPRYYSV